MEDYLARISTLIIVVSIFIALAWRFVPWKPSVKWGITVFLIAVTVNIFFTEPEYKPVQNISAKTPPIKLSADQKTMVSEMGYPDGFTLSLEEFRNKIVRKEVWRYYGLGSVFIFRDGSYLGTRDSLPRLPKNAVLPKARPDQISSKANLNDLIKAFGKSIAEADINGQIVEGSQVYQFNDGLTAGIKDGKLIYVQSLPYLNKGGSLP